ncbi:hypothetical protein BJ878DRAFT_545127 [Calycina marina]|uniref:Uncharacterized protein n=1 Tax=Calycina marina TaxID=1763456 RepID=A0A9P7YWZ3_9HELO|nr:hypothetical protein BJ878DRAFT_545127 [Calycina marina]
MSFRGNFFGAVLDYHAIPSTYKDYLLDGTANNVPILTGNTKDGSGATFGKNIASLQTQYGATFATRFLALHTTANSLKSGNWIRDHAPLGQMQGSHHESKINYVLNNLYDTDLPCIAVNTAIAETMSGYWVTFAEDLRSKWGPPNEASVLECK